MKKILVLAFLMLISCALSGCVVRSIYPWFPGATKVTDVSLVGTWHDDNEDETVFFTSGSDTNYDVLLVKNTKDQSGFTASLHRFENTLFLVVGSGDRSDMGTITTLPAYLLF